MVSIIIPIYNSEDFLDSCIESIINQNYKDFELILIDDGSKDNSWNICQQWVGKDCRINIYRQDNKGASSARNLGLDVAKGEWILYVDSDDKVLPNYVSNLINAVEKDSNNVLAISGVQIIRDNKFAGQISFQNLTCNVENYKQIFGSIRLHKYGFSVGKLYNRLIIEKNHLRFDEKVCIAEDCMFLLNYLMYLADKNKSQITFIKNCDYLYYIRQNSLSTGSSPFEKEFYSYNQYRYYINEVKNKFLIDDATFNKMHSPIVFYADRVINSIYNKKIIKRKERISLLHKIDRNEYCLFKKGHSLFERLLLFLFSKGFFHIYDIIRVNI